MAWQPLLIGAVVGFVIGVLIMWLRARSANQGYEYYLSQTRNEVETLKGNVSALERERTGLKANVSTQSQELSALTAARDEAEQRRADLEAQIAQSQQASADLQAEIKRLQEQSHEADASALVQLQQLQQANAAWKVRDEQALAAIAAWKARLTDAQQEVASLKGQLEATLVDLGKVREENGALAENLDNKEIALDEAYRRVTNLQREVTDATERMVAAESQLVSLNRDVATLGTVNQDLENKLHGSRGQVAGELAILTSTMFRMKDEALTRANARIAALSAEVETLKKSRAAVG